MINQKGQSLVEAVIALGVAAIVVSAMAVAAITSINNADFSKYQNLATQYAQEGLEIVRQQSQTNWTTFSAKTPVRLTQYTYCLDQNTTNLYAPPLGSSCGKNINLGNNPFFVREVILTQTNFNVAYTTPSVINPACNGTIQATVSVAWTDGKCSSSSNYCHNVTLSSCFANLNGQ